MFLNLLNSNAVLKLLWKNIFRLLLTFECEVANWNVTFSKFLQIKLVQLATTITSRQSQSQLVGMGEILLPRWYLGRISRFQKFDFEFQKSFQGFTGHCTPRGEGDADFKIHRPATQKNYRNATAAPPEPGRNFGPAFGGHTIQNRTRLCSRNQKF